MEHRFFWRNFYRFAIPLIMPIIVFGLISMGVTFNYAVSQSNQNSLDMLCLARENLELMLSDVDFLTVLIDSNRSNSSAVRSILREPDNSYDMSVKADFITGLIATPTYSKPFIHSLYIYVDNPYGRFLSSANGISYLSNTYDIAWYDNYKKANSDILQWVEMRYIKSYSRDENPQQVITVYRRLINSNGIIVLNIKQSYFYNMIEQLTRYNSKSLVVTDSEGKVLFTNMASSNFWESRLNLEEYPMEKPILIYAGNEKQLITKLESDKFNWTYISFIPGRALYDIPKRLFLLTLAVLSFIVVGSIVMAYFITRKNYRNILDINNIFSAAEEGKTIPSMPKQAENEYSYIIQNILKTFIEQDYLKMQLSVKQLNLKNAELLALQSQLNPHFIFNTLETINLEFLNITKKPTNANKMITDLALLLQYVFSNQNKTIKLGDEIENTKRYIELQSYRYEDKFYVRWNVDSNVINYQIIPLILQPLVENSIYHGAKDKEGRCGIKISIQMTLDGFHIRITDNGLGIMPEMLAVIRYNLAHPEIDPGKHIGLYNVNKRLAIIYGDEYHISIYSRHNIGTYIHIFLSNEHNTEAR